MSDDDPLLEQVVQLVALVERLQETMGIQRELVTALGARVNDLEAAVTLLLRSERQS